MTNRSYNDPVPTNEGATLRLRWPIAVEGLWFVTAIFLTLLSIAEPSFGAVALALCVSAIGGFHLLHDRSLRPAVYWLSATGTVALSVAAIVGIWTDPSEGQGEWIATCALLAFMTFASVRSFRPIPVWSAPSSSPVAFDERRTRASHRIYLASRFMLLLAGISLLGMATAGAIRSGDRTENLEQTGYQVTGVIDSFGGNGLLGGDTVIVRFRSNGQDRNEAIQLNDSSPRYGVGQSVEVLIDPSNPASLTLRGESNDPRTDVWLFSFGFVFGTLALGFVPAGFLAAGRQRRLFLEENWRDASFKHGCAGYGRNQRHVIRMTEGADTHVVSVAAMTPWTLPGAKLRRGGALEVIGDCGRHGIIRFENSRRLFHVWSPRRSSTRNRWSTAIDRANSERKGHC